MNVSPEQDAVDRVLRNVRGRLVKARDLLQAESPQELDVRIPGIDGLLRDAFHMLNNCRRFLTLYRPPQYAMHDLASELRQGAGLKQPLVDVEPDRPCNVEIDLEQTLECLVLLRNSIRVGRGERVTADLYRTETLPHLMVHAQGGAVLPQTFPVGQSFEISRQAFAERWASATNGGEIEFIPEGLLLGLRGPVPVPQGESHFAAILGPVKRAADNFRAWRGASAHYDPGYASLDETRRLYQAAVERGLEYVAQALK